MKHAARHIRIANSAHETLTFDVSLLIFPPAF